MEAYLDNSATTCAFARVCDIMMKTMSEDYGNPSSMHSKGFHAEHYVNEAREAVAKSLRVNDREIIFTSGGTESNNMALIGCAMANKRKGNHLITTVFEHASVGNTMRFLEEQGFRVTYLPVDHEGTVSLRALEEAICPETILVSIMYVNNEVGSVQPIEEIARIIRRKKPDILFHVDAIQAYGKYVIRPRRQGIDLLSVSGHKIHGPKGTGFLYVRDKVKIKPIIFGGEQQHGMRSGTENVPGIAGLGEAVKEIYKDHDARVAGMYELKKLFVEQLADLDDIVINGQPLMKGAPHIVSVSFRGIRSEVLLHALEERGIYVSAGSACSSNHPAVSGTLKSIGVEKELLDSTLRFSFSIFTTADEIRYAADTLKELVPMLRRFRRG
ncbi:MAG: cysteine desulfurase family protein [Lachnospiraceae bacterium]|nr:cysteine desulfurase family protein [Lachnospiraceae bacterium]